MLLVTHKLITSNWCLGNKEVLRKRAKQQLNVIWVSMRVFSRPGFNPLICKLRKNLPSYSVAFTESQNLSAKDKDGGLHSWLLSENPLFGFLATSSTPDYGKSGSLGTIHLITLQYQIYRVSHSKSARKQYLRQINHKKFPSNALVFSFASHFYSHFVW